ncbi:hypothetical protein J8J42_07890 [Chryseobacterium sp. cx-311]|uniref:hypothetical protein n=1 Tax=Marnyiella aurantia TaxID=2758037 RepID=UPI001AEA0CA8|nr:hypothetical protein [Marnyiella aurantia]MBP0612965.1 hypothetical protein [Marnyiella aurantia]
MKFNNQKLRNYDPGVGEELLEDRTRLWISILLSQARGPIPPADLLDMLPLEVREDRAYAMSAIRHLYRSLETLEIGHATLREFLLKRHSAFMQEGNALLLQFCRDYPDRPYSVANTLYHDALSAYPLNAVLDCTQDWADRAALYHVNPEWILEDVKGAAELAVKMQLPAESVRLALLLKRLNVRYRTTFAEFREELASALIAQKKFGEVLLYLTRNNALQVTADRAFHFLGKLYAGEAWAEAAQLRTAIDQQFRSELDDSLRSALYYAAMEAKTPWNAPVFAPDPCTYPDMEWSAVQTVQLIWDHCVAWNDPLMLTYGELLSSGEDLDNLLDCAEDNSRIASYAKSVLEFGRVFGTGTMQRLPVSAVLRTMTANLEAMIRIYGAPHCAAELAILITPLIHISTDTALLRDLMTQYLYEHTSTSLWTPNRVDVDFESYERMSLAAVCRGYLHDGAMPEVKAKKWHAKSWQTDLQQLINEVYFLEGAAQYQKASRGMETEKLQNCLLQLVPTMRFTLDSRSQWERSYQLPEQVFPLLWEKVISLTHGLVPDDLPQLLQEICNGCTGQLGLYSEGFRKVMAATAGALLPAKVDRKFVLQLMERWQEHVLSGIQNRWERCEELISIAECYGLYNDKDKAAFSWQRMLESSMGPFWRGESQFGLITETLKHFPTASGTALQNFAAILDSASGEMTFPNAVKPFKEEFAGILTAAGMTEKALAYYKFEVLPPPEVVLMNAESSTFDAPTRGAGYRLGAANLRESRALMEILGHLECDPYLKWGLCSLFVPTTASSREVQLYGSGMADILNEIETLKDGKTDQICEDWTLRLSRSLDRKTLRKLAGVLMLRLSPTNSARIEGFIQVNEPMILEDTGSTGPFGGPLNGLKDGGDTGVSRQGSHWVQHLLSPADDYGFDTEALCSGLEQLLNAEAGELPGEELLDVISKHFQYLVCPDKASTDKYSWLNRSEQSVSGNQMALQLLIWHLNHPDNAVSIRAEETLITLVSVVPQTVKELLEQCIEDRPEPATELCSMVLYQASVKYPSVTGAALQKFPSIIGSAAAIRHLSIRKNLMDAGTELKRAGFTELSTAVHSNLQETVAVAGEPYVPHLAFASLQDVLDDLQSGHFLDQQFSENITKLMGDYCFPLTHNKVKMSDWYVRRSFNREQWLSGSYNHFVKHALNNAVAHRITRENIESVYEIVNE